MSAAELDALEERLSDLASNAAEQGLLRQSHAYSHARVVLTEARQKSLSRRINLRRMKFRKLLTRN